MSKTEAQLEIGIAADDKWAKRCGWPVIAGLVLETFLTWVFPAHASAESNWILLDLETWGPVFADALVAGGVWGEIFFSGRMRKSEEELRRISNDKVVTAVKAAGEANERAANAELETQKLKEQFAWRRISIEQQRMLIHSLQKLTGASLTIWYFMNDPESQNFALDFGAVFRIAGWKVAFTAATYAENFVFEIRIPFRDGQDEPASKIMREAFTNAGIDFMPLSIPRPQMSSSYGQAAITPWGHLYVGPKPMPTLE